MNGETSPDPLAIQRPRRRYGLDEAIHPVQVAAYRRAKPEQKLAQVIQMYQAGIALKTMGLRSRHPDWCEEQLRREAQRIFTYGIS